jgi:predicted CXXCH cytochrome family protein
VKSVMQAPTALTASLKLGPGLHELALSSGQKVRVFVPGATSAPSGWGIFKAHPPAAECSACHVGKWTTAAASCMACHDAAKFPVTHTHAVSVLEECQLCHQPHGSKTSFHLRFSKETACKQCHG